MTQVVLHTTQNGYRALEHDLTRGYRCIVIVYSLLNQATILSWNVGLQALFSYLDTVLSIFFNLHEYFQSFYLLSYGCMPLLALGGVWDCSALRFFATRFQLHTLCSRKKGEVCGALFVEQSQALHQISKCLAPVSNLDICLLHSCLRLNSILGQGQQI
jgi:hypothetical protein